jgi:hypothetical protein
MPLIPLVPKLHLGTGKILTGKHEDMKYMKGRRKGD